MKHEIYMLPSKTGLPGSDTASQSHKQSLVLEFYPTNQLVGSKFDSGDLKLLLIGSTCSKDLTFGARGTSARASAHSQFSQHRRLKTERSDPYLWHSG